MAKVMYNGQEVEVIDCTPTWEGMLRGMLNVYIRHAIDSGLANDKEAEKNKLDLEQEFLRMARLADKWVEYQQSKA